ncbi:hypothetical protein MKEN_00752500 [Mycena kentingensis (nom. inval.)]|nr:hypothetical protein MKEN_00752500 [Mycena kentingensis (nom. inval.)]
MLGRERICNYSCFCSHVVLPAMSRAASHPFSPPSPDELTLNPPTIILRSADRVDFYAHKSLLAFNAPVLRAILSNRTEGRAQASSTTNLPVVHMRESSAALRLILLLCYPRSAFPTIDIASSSLNGVDEACTSMARYHIPSHRDFIHTLLTAPRTLAAHPYRVFAIACHHAFWGVARRAAGVALRQEALAPTAVVPEMDLIPAGQLRKLLRLRSDAGRAIGRVMRGYVDRYGPDGACWREPEAQTDDGEFNFVPSDVEGPGVALPFWWRDTHSPACTRAAEYEPDWAYAAGPPASHPPAWVSAHLARLTALALLRPDAAYIANQVEFISGGMLREIAKCGLCVAEAPAELGRMAAEVRERAGRDVEEMLACANFEVP